MAYTFGSGHIEGKSRRALSFRPAFSPAERRILEGRWQPGQFGRSPWDSGSLSARIGAPLLIGAAFFPSLNSCARHIRLCSLFFLPSRSPQPAPQHLRVRRGLFCAWRFRPRIGASPIYDGPRSEEGLQDRGDQRLGRITNQQPDADAEIDTMEGDEMPRLTCWRSATATKHGDVQAS